MMGEKHPQKDTLQPNERDILFGRDDFSIKHVGNESFRTLIGFCLEEYKALPGIRRSRKSQFLRHIVECILQSEGRFLKRIGKVGDDWITVSKEEARQKVGQELRDVRKHPHILEGFSLVNSPEVSRHFRSASDFDWGGIVEACEHELEALKLRRAESPTVRPIEYMYQDGVGCDLNLQELFDDLEVPSSASAYNTLSRLSTFSEQSDFSIHSLGLAV